MAKKIKKLLATCLVISMIMSLLTVSAGATEYICGKEEHTHSDACYELVQICGETECTQKEHTHRAGEDYGCVPHGKHTEDCYSLKCGLEEGLICTLPVHTHDERCAECTQEEHTHDDSCAGCTRTEHEHDEEKCYHTHTAMDAENGCYSLNCTLSSEDCELKVHSHEESGCHFHDESCDVSIVDCGQDVHVHSVMCKVVGKDKTAKWADESMTVADVKLSVPGDVEIKGADIVFVIDKSSCGTYATKQFQEMFTALAEAQAQSGADIKVAVVQFNYTDHLDLPLTKLTSENVEELLGKIQKYSSGTNMESGLLVAQDILAEDTSVPAENKYVILVSDGLTWVYDDENGKPCTILWENSAGRADAATDGYTQTRKPSGKNLDVPDGYTWDEYWKQIQTWVAVDGDKFDYTMIGYGSDEWEDGLKTAAAKEAALTSAEGKNHAVNMDRAMYDAWKVYTELQAAGYNCYVNNVGTMTNSNGYHFMNMLAGDQKAVDFASIQNSIIHSVSKNSRVEDYIGYSADANEGYNFDFVTDPESITLTVAGVEYITTQLETAKEGYDASYTFAAEGKEATFWLDYVKGNGTTEEKFVWTFGEDVSAFYPATLDYQVTLVSKQSVANQRNYIVKTNQSATLYPVDSNGTAGTSGAFPDPQLIIPKFKVTYEYIGDVPSGVRAVPDTKYYFAGEKVYTASGENYKMSDYIFYGWNDPCNALAAGVMPAHDVTLNGYYVTNTHTPETVDVIGSKTWEDDDDRDGLRPTSITINLLADGTVKESKTITATDGWKWSFEDLPKYKNGQEIEYTITENEVSGYKTAINGYDVTNTHEIEKTSISVEKKWEDNENQDGKRKSITVDLYANDKKVDGKSVTLSDENGWKSTWTELPKNENGVAIAYTVDEASVPDGYAKKITGDAATGYIITNTHTPETINISGEKTWNDNNNQDGIRPTSITINLKADGEQIKSTIVKADADGKWKYEFTGLDKYKNGTAIKYEITEQTVDGYETKIEGYNVTNTHKTAETEITVKKVWDDNNNRDGIRPASIQVQLLADGSTYGEPVTLSGSGDEWTYTWEKLPVKAAGKKITYSVAEIGAITGYTTKIEGFTITNSHKIAETEISGSKTWNDANDQDGKRPESITIRLWNGSTEVRTATVNADKDGNWTYKFTGLPKNENGQPINYTITEDAVDGYTAKVDGYDVTNTHIPGKTSVSVTKAWSDDDNRDGIRPTEIKVQLKANGAAKGEAVTLNADNNWTYTWTDLDEKAAGQAISYTVVELNVPEGYKATTSGTAEDGYTITNTHGIEKTKVEGKKTWDDKGNQDGKRPERITIHLWADGTEIDSKTVTAADDWKWSFTDLPVNKNGKAIAYTITEDGVSGYSTTVNGYNVTNSYTPGKTSVTVNKAWVDDGNRDGIRPTEIKVQLLANGAAKGEPVALTAETGWTYTWNELDEMSGGKVITYTVAEVGTVTGYISTVDGYTITNIHEIEKTSVSGSKTWNDANDQDGKRPTSITINLLANGEKIDSKVVTAANGWAWIWTDLYKYANGQEIKYTITEDAVTDYSTTYDGYNVTNSYTPGKTSISVNKIWVDDNDRDDLRPESIQVQLLANGEVRGEAVTLSAENDWSYSWTGLDQKAAGKDITYTVDEVSVPAGYSKSITGDAATGYTITNTHGVVLTSVNGSKTWNDNNDQDGKRPASITINLLANGVKIQSKTVTAADGWKWSFENLPVNENGKKVTYSITEDAVAGYSSAVKGYDVTNSYDPGKTSVGVTKVWDDDGDRDGVRPASVTVKLLANGNDTGKTLTLDANNGWSGSFTGLDEYVSGSRINYTIEEVTVAGYTVAITGSAAAGFTVTNSRGTDKTTVSGSKTWVDNNDQDGKRPASITINLFANGEKVDSKVVTAADGWKWSFTGLPKNEGGKAITYTITEDTVPGYSTEVKGYDVINSYTPGKTSVTVKKEWNDDGNRDGIRPVSISVQLLANGTAKGEAVTLTAENSWTYTWNGLDEKAGGKTIDYTVAEVGSVEGYTSTVNGYTITNTHEVKKTSIDVEKVWKNTSNPPEIDVIIKLLADGEEVKSLALNEGNNWKGTFTDLPVNKAGTAITYTIEEVKVSGFTTKITGSADEGFVVTNTKKDYDRPDDDDEDKDDGPAETSYTLTADKTLNGKKANGFTFEVKDANGTVVATASAKSGKITFPTFKYDAEGTYTYTVSEAAGTNSNVIYDDSVYTLTVTVSKNGEDLVAACTGLEKDGEPVEAIRFENTYDGERFYDDDEEELFEEDIPLGGLDAPETGDAGMLWALTAAVSGMGLVGLNFFPKKRKEDEE